jgi:molybdopterin synthase sulfur carrier subunit
MSGPGVRVLLPSLLRDMIGAQGEIALDIAGPVTQASVIDSIEARYPMLRGTLRDAATRRRRSLVRFYACEQDLSHDEPDAPLPEAVARGAEPYLVVGAIAGG